MKAQGGRGGVEVQLYSFFNVGARWGGWSMPRPGRFTPGKDPAPTCRKLDRSVRGKENFAPNRDSILGASSPLPVAYRLSYYGSTICNSIDMQLYRYKINQKIYSLDKANSYQIYKLWQLYLTTRLAVCGSFRNLLLDY